MNSSVERVSLKRWPVQTDFDHAEDCPAEYRSMSPNGALPIIPPPEFVQEGSALHPMRSACSVAGIPFPASLPTFSVQPHSVPDSFYKPSSGPFGFDTSRHTTRTRSPSTTPPRRRSDFRKEGIPGSSNKYLLDDDEFAFTAHVILQQLNRLSENEKDQGCPNITVDNFWFLITGEREVNRTGVTFTAKELEDFQVALKQRMKHLPYRPRPKEDPLIRLTRNVAQAVAIWGFPEPRAEKVDDKHLQRPIDRKDDVVAQSNPRYHSENNTASSPTAVARRESNGSRNLPSNDSAYENKLRETERLHLQREQERGGTDFDDFAYDWLDDEELHPQRTQAKVDYERYSAPRVFEVESIAASEPHSASETQQYEVVGDYLMPLSLTSKHDLEADRSFEKETVVLRETLVCSPPQSPNSTSKRQFDGRTNLPQSPRLKQKLKDEIRRVTKMLNMTTNDVVRQSCLKRLERLRIEFLEAQDFDRSNTERTVPARMIGNQSSNQRQNDLPHNDDDAKPDLPFSPSVDSHPDDDDRYRVEQMVGNTSQ